MIARVILTDAHARCTEDGVSHTVDDLSVFRTIVPLVKWLLE